MVRDNRVLRVWQRYPRCLGAGMAHESTREGTSGIPVIHHWGGSSGAYSFGERYARFWY